ncbi:MAG TPA: putative toxin-antitoxin system toxin component, PIN family [Calditrichia bacterium]|nr:putative toxin-antitoxin system toxin component, PIN family [Calditrichota bacterium]HQV31029.1 putative toxin-antitoxin system toxin component, PIN family [Calditrichia bacterium]
MTPLIVLDTNVLVSGLCRRKGSDSYRILRGIQKREIPVALTQKLCSEYEAVLNRPAIIKLTGIQNREIDTIIDGLIALAQLAETHYLWRPNLTDENDNFVLEAAVATGALIVTQNLKDFQGGELRFPELQVFTPTQFNQLYL